MKTAYLIALLVVNLNAASLSGQTDNPPKVSNQPLTKTACPGHGHEPGGRAVDINEVNGKPVTLYGRDPDVTRAVGNLQAAANRSGPGEPGAAAENYGPAGLWRNGKQVRDVKLQNRFHNHIHILPPNSQ